MEKLKDTQQRQRECKVWYSISTNKPSNFLGQNLIRFLGALWLDVHAMRLETLWCMWDIEDMWVTERER